MKPKSIMRDLGLNLLFSYDINSVISWGRDYTDVIDNFSQVVSTELGGTY